MVSLIRKDNYLQKEEAFFARLATIINYDSFEDVCYKIHIRPKVFDKMISDRLTPHNLILQPLCWFLNVNYLWLTLGPITGDLSQMIATLVPEVIIRERYCPHEYFWTNSGDRTIWLLWTSGYSISKFCKNIEVPEAKYKAWMNCHGFISEEAGFNITKMHPSIPGKYWGASNYSISKETLPKALKTNDPYLPPNLSLLKNPIIFKASENFLNISIK